MNEICFNWKSQLSYPNHAMYLLLSSPSSTVYLRASHKMEGAHAVSYFHKV